MGRVWPRHGGRGRPLNLIVRFHLPLIHFAFSSHHRSGRHDLQVAALIEHILSTRRLRASVCPEFLPLISAPGAMVPTAKAASSKGDGIVLFDKPEMFVPAPPVRLLPESVWMICFVNVAFNKLRSWPASDHYGSLGIAFTDAFSRRAGIRRVAYYQYPNLARDPLVIRLNQAHAGGTADIEHLTQEVVHYRKPARLWAGFNDLITALTLTREGDGSVKVEKPTYSRYQIGYDFEAEREARKVMSENSPDLEFLESEVLALIAPDQAAADAIDAFLREAWATPPIVMVRAK